VPPTPADRLAELLLAEASGALPALLPFYGHEPTGPGTGPWVLTQWWPSPFDVEGVRYPTAEHWMMAAKARAFGDEQALRQILAAPGPEQAKQLGRGVRGFDSAAWAAVAYGVVVEGNRHKFAAGPERDYLVGTGADVLVEASPVDLIWGSGRGEEPSDLLPSRWTGRNLLGFALMDVRDELAPPGR